jgi:hypothetical protein
MRIKNLSILILVLLAVSVLAAPVDLKLVKLRPEVDAYRYSAERGWRVYFAADEMVLADAPKSFGDAVISSQPVYRGDDANLRWVYYRRGQSPEVTGSRVLFNHPGSALVELGPWELLMADTESGYRLQPVQPLAAKAETTIVNPALQRDSSISTLVNLVDSARVRNRLLRLQAFGTRYYRATSHHALVDTLRNTFTGYGITDVRSDTFATSASNHGHNVIATIPGRIDNSVNYIVGGHYDSYAGGSYLTHAPGADDNASGTVAALEMARILAGTGRKPAFTVKAIAFDAEEIGLYGSDSFAQRAKKAGTDIRCMLNYDMVGALDSAGKKNDSLFVSKVYSGMTIYAQLLGKMAGWYGRLADTNLVAKYNSIYLNGSDSWTFYNQGYPVTYSEEYVFCDKYHTGRDSVRYLNVRYCTSIIRAGMGMLATLANYPLKVRNVTVIPAKGQLTLRWSANTQTNVTGYRVYWGRQPRTYTGSQLTASRLDTTCSIGGLLTDSTYYLAVAAVDDSGRPSVLLGEVSAVATATLGVAFGSMTAQSAERGIAVSWLTHSENNCFRWEIERAPSGGEYRLIGQVPGHGTTAQPQSYCFTDTLVQAGQSYSYRLAELDAAGQRTLYGPVSAQWLSGPAVIFDLGPAHPNPASLMAEVSYSIPTAGTVNLTVYDVSGRRVRTLVGGPMPAGRFTARWDCADQTGRRAAKGVYFFRLQCRGQDLIRRLVLVR